MIEKNFQGLRMPALGLGTMRLPLAADGSVDEARVAEMVETAMQNGVNYFDTAYPYHGGTSELVMGRVLSRYPRESYYLADKYPGHQVSPTYYPADIFEEQLKKCGVTYFDFYLLHNVYENSVSVYMDPRWGIIDYFVEQKRLGRIRHLGFSCHGGLPLLRDFLDRYGAEMEFCQLQLNYLDWTLQQGKEKYELLTERGIPVWVMEPVRGGRLAHLPDAGLQRLTGLRPEENAVSWCFRFLQGLPNVGVILSGMSDMTQLRENIETFRVSAPPDERENRVLQEVADLIRASIPCTGCRYCCDGCPQGLDIPFLLGIYNEIRYEASVNAAMRLDALPPEKRPEACIGCGACEQSCPQKIAIPEGLKDMSRILSKIPKWSEICRKRAEEAAKLREK